MSYYKDFREYIATLDSTACCAASPLPSARTPSSCRWCACSSAAFRPSSARRSSSRTSPMTFCRQAVPRPARRRRAGRQPGSLRDRAGMRSGPASRALGGGAQSYIEPQLVADGPGHGRDPRRRRRCWSTTASLSSRIPSPRPGFDPAPYFTSPFWVTKDPETGSATLAPTGSWSRAGRRAGMMAHQCQHIGLHLQSARASGQDRWRRRSSSAARPPSDSAASPRSPIGVDEFAVAGGIAGEPIELVKCRTVDLEVPATRRDRDRRLRGPHLPRAGGAVRRVHRLHGHPGGQPGLPRDRHHAPQDTRVPGLPQPVPALGEQPDPQAWLRRRLSEAPALGQHPRGARRAAP